MACKIPDWRLAAEIGTDVVDKKLWPGAAREGWRIMPMARGSDKCGKWCYYHEGVFLDNLQCVHRVRAGESIHAVQCEAAAAKLRRQRD